MATEEPVNPLRRGGGRGRGRGRGRGESTSNDTRSPAQGSRRGSRGGFSSSQKPGQAGEPKPLPAESKGKEVADGEEEAEVCFICASEIDHYAVPPCNHRTCHICSLRMRALYQTKYCPHCRVSPLHSPAPPQYSIYTN
jgi:E3 ubiquitin-protein ligase ZNF598